MRACLAVLVVVTAAWSSAATAQDNDACAGFKWPITRERQALGAADLPTLSSGGALPALGQGVTVALRPQAEVTYAVKPARAPRVEPAYGAALALPPATIAQTIQVTLSADAWVDVVQGGKMLRSSGFSGKSGCADVRKSVRFAIAPGPSTLEISAAPETTVRLVVEPSE